MRGLFIGRFQPLHLGHVAIMETALSEVDELVVGIGSAESSYTPTDPFSAGERMEMLLGCAMEYGWGGRLIPVPVRDVNRYSIWVDHVVSLVPKFDRVFSNNPLTSSLFRNAGFEVCSTKMVDRKHFSGTAIRDHMRTGGEWRRYVPRSTAELIEHHRWIERMTDIWDGDQ
ncbi:MAG: nicotinamide-nucleotide adenylyltransferase [Candidatus Thermoplasmatota archaeon]|nr:nicotinamide-nucleotide adenylyltransferase [Candidatus Thermoplasmatota archaeon]